MTANDTTDDGGKKRTVLENHDLGSRQVGLGGVDGVATAVDIPPEHYDDDTISVRGFAFDDEPGHVTLDLGRVVTINVDMNPEQARALADRLDAAADEAEGDL